MKNTRGSEWHKWDLHLHTASSYDSHYKGKDEDKFLCKALKDNDISAVALHIILKSIKIEFFI